MEEEEKGLEKKKTEKKTEKDGLLWRVTTRNGQTYATKINSH